MLAKIRKSLIAGFGAGIGAAVAVESEAGWHVTAATVSHALAALILAGVPVGWATWRAPNAAPASTPDPTPAPAAK